MSDVRVMVWNEYRHERENEEVAAIYPDGIHSTIADALAKQGFTVRTAILDDPEHGLPDHVLQTTDVMVWWSHMARQEVADGVVDKVQQRVLDGMGLIVLHSAHLSKPFIRLMGTGCYLKWRHDDYERLWVVAPGHPIAQGIGEYIDLEGEEMYGEPFDVPPPEELVFLSWFRGGEVFRSGCCYTRGRGRIFYFRPGHESVPTYHHPGVQRIIANAVRWAAPTQGPPSVMGYVRPVEEGRNR